MEAKYSYRKVTPHHCVNNKVGFSAFSAKFFYFGSAILTAFIAARAFMPFFESFSVDRESEIKSEVKIQTYELRQNIRFFNYRVKSVKDGEVSPDNLWTAVALISDPRAEVAKKMLYMEDHYPEEGVNHQVMSKRGYEIKAFYRGGEPYIHFIGLDKSFCDNLKYAVCEKSSSQNI